LARDFLVHHRTECRLDGAPATSGVVCGKATVPKKLIGCWRRRYIRFHDGSADTTTRVIWLQTLSGAGDIRIAADRPNLKSRGGLSACTKDELLALAEQDCFAGQTLFDAEADPHPTARWPLDGYLFRFQPVVTFPEDGWMDWKEDGTCMIEKAPSAAYEEDWRLEPGSQTFAAHLTQRGTNGQTCLYVAGDHAIFARNREVALSANKSLPELAKEAGNDEARLRELVDCEFSYARRPRPGGDYTIELSTLPWHEGQTLNCAWVEHLFSDMLDAGHVGLAEMWMIESFWRA